MRSLLLGPLSRGPVLRWSLLILAVVLGFLGTSVSPSANPALAFTPYADIGDTANASPPDLRHVYIGNELSCQVAHSLDGPVLELYPSDTIPGDCGTFLAVDNTLYAPDLANHGISAASTRLGAYTPFQPVSQTLCVTNPCFGTTSAPYQVVTVADATPSGIRITQTDSYVVGAQSYRTDVQVTNTSSLSKSVILYRAGDCFLGGSDRGFGRVNLAPTLGVACTKNANNTPPGRVEEWLAITPPDHYYEDAYNKVWPEIGTKTSLPDTCACSTSLDNAVAINWERTINAGSSETFSHSTVFSPLGTPPPPPPFCVITVVKRTIPVGGSDFSFSSSYPSLNNLTLDDDEVGSILVPCGSAINFFEEAKAGWVVSDITCSVTSGAGDFDITGSSSPLSGRSGFTAGDTGVNFTLGPGSAQLECTFTNTLPCVNPTKVVVSDANVEVRNLGAGPSGAAPATASPYPGVPSQWNTSMGVTGFGPVTLAAQGPAEWLDNLGVATAQWVSVNGGGYGPDFFAADDFRDVYLYRVPFSLPAGATNIVVKAEIAADNYGWLYVNGGPPVLGPKSTAMTSSSGDSSNWLEVNKSMTTVLGSLIGVHPGNNVLAAEVHNWTAKGFPHLWTGVIFSLEICYDAPIGGKVGLTVSSSGSAVPWTPLAAIVAGALAVLAAGGWYARRWWLS